VLRAPVYLGAPLLRKKLSWKKSQLVKNVSWKTFVNSLFLPTDLGSDLAKDGLGKNHELVKK